MNNFLLDFIYLLVTGPLPLEPEVKKKLTSKIYKNSIYYKKRYFEENNVVIKEREEGRIRKKGVERAAPKERK
jgi:hypothetical protein